MATSVNFENERNRFIKNYNNLSAQCLEMQKVDIVGASNIHIRISNMIAEFLKRWRNVKINVAQPGAAAVPRDVMSVKEIKFLQIECVARAFECIQLRSLSLSGFVELSINMTSQKKFLSDITSLLNATDETGAGISGIGGGDEKDLADVKSFVTFIPWSSNRDRLENMIGYQDAGRKIRDAYFIIRPSPEEHHEGAPPRATVTAEHSNSNFGSNVILYGPPGTGKTSTARAAAGSLGIDCYFVNSENLVSSYRSETEKNLSRLYAFVRKSIEENGRNALLLLDEVDGIVKSRQAGDINSSDYSLLTKFLTILEPLDGADNSGIMSVFTTNILENLDPAFRRRCTSIQMSHIDSVVERGKLISYFFMDTLEKPVSDTEILGLAENLRDWVPGDYVRFIRTLWEPERMNRYLRNRGMSTEVFYQTLRSEGATNRIINVDLPLLPFSTLVDLTSDFEPTTPR